MRKRILLTICYWFIGLALFCLAYCLIYFSSLHVILSSYADGALFRTTIDVAFNIPQNIALLGGDFTTGIELNIINALGLPLKSVIENVEFQGFKIDYIACGLLLASLLAFIVNAIFKKFKTINYVCGSLIILSGVGLFFETYSFAYFNKDNFSNLNTYLESTDNIKIEYSNINLYIGASIIVFVGLLIITCQIVKSIKIKKNTSIKN